MTISALDRGSLVHDILRRFVATCQERGTLPEFGQPWRPEHRALLLELAEEECQSAQARGITGRRLLWDVAREEMRQDLAAFIEEDNRWRAKHGARPVFVEKGFGFNDVTGLPPVKLSLEDGTALYFRGQIDRVDANASGSTLIVTDYKSGSASYYDDMKSDPLGRGHHLQLPVYALAARETHPQAEVIGQYWFVTARGNFELRTVNLGEVEERFTGVVATIAAGIQRGLFPADPGPSGRNGPQNCRFCDFDRICPANRDFVAARKLSDSALALYRELAGHGTGEEDE